jgi:hypothetical protein
MELNNQYNNLRLPAKNLLCAPGTGAAIVTHTFEISGTKPHPPLTHPPFPIYTIPN